MSTFCDGVGMLRQTTLFREALPSKKYFVYKNVIDTYQKFVEVFAASTAKENRRHDYVCVTLRGGGVFFNVTMTLSVEFSFGDAPLAVLFT